MAREIDLSATEGYLKYTVTLAGVGFVFAQTRLGTASSLFGFEAMLGISLPKLAFLTLLAIFFVSSVTGISAISTIAGIRNDAAWFKALPPNRRHAHLPAHTLKRGQRMSTARRLSDVHLVSLIVAFSFAMVVFLGEVFNPRVQPERCHMRLGPMQITYPCGASPEDVWKHGSIRS